MMVKDNLHEKHPICRAGNIFFSSGKDICPTTTPSWSDKIEFWSDITKKRVNFIFLIYFIFR